MTVGSLLNVGNTHTQVADRGPGGFGAVTTLSTADWLQGTVSPALPDQGSVLVASVVPRATAWLRKHLGTRLHLLSWREARGIDTSHVDPTAVGADRIANVLGALTMHPPPLIIVDCGTAITIEVVDAQRRFRGGAILPGRRMMRRALHRQTGLLPDVPLGDDHPDAIGTTTQGAIRAGVDVGVIGAVRELLRETAAALGTDDVTVLAVGGDAAYVADRITQLTAGPSDLTLRGLDAAAQGLD